MNYKDMQMQFDYHRWATARMLDTCEKLPEEALLEPVGGAFGTLFATLVHAYSAEDVWLARWQGEERGFTQPDAFSGLESLRNTWTHRQDELSSFLQTTDPDEIFEVRGYRHPLWQMLLHLVDHGSFHRGQTMYFVREAGGEPRPSNFIHYLRVSVDEADA